MNHTKFIIPLLLTVSLGVAAQDHKQSNYDEAKIPPYELPGILVDSYGRIVMTAEQWEQERRPELLELFAGQEYGKLPQGEISMTCKVLEEAFGALGGRAVRKQVELTFSAGEVERKALLLMYLPARVKEDLPAGAEGKSPVFLMYNFKGNQTVSADENIIASQYSDAERGSMTGRWPLEMIVDGGYGIATLHYYDFFPDRETAYEESVLPLFFPEGQINLTGECGRAIACWAWGYSRVLDYLQTDPLVDGDKIIVAGHSRLGKTAVWAGAADERFAMVVSNESGCGGAAISRRRFGETINRITSVYPHWFCGNFLKYQKKEDDLPMDQHQLLALIAPRPLYVASAEGDLWSDPKGEFLSAVYVSGVYRLYGFSTLEDAPEVVMNETTPDGVDATTGASVNSAQPAQDTYPDYSLPAVNTPIHTRVGYHIRPGRHEVTSYDWENYIAFADLWLK